MFGRDKLRHRQLQHVGLDGGRGSDTLPRIFPCPQTIRTQPGPGMVKIDVKLYGVGYYMVKDTLQKVTWGGLLLKKASTVGSTVFDI